MDTGRVMVVRDGQGAEELLKHSSLFVYLLADRIGRSDELILSCRDANLPSC